MKSELSCDSLKLAHLNICNDDIEAQWLIIKPYNLKTMVIGNIYRPNTGKHKNFTATLEQALNEIDSLPDWEIQLMGDFNLDYLVASTPGLKNLKYITRQAGLTQLIGAPTRITPKTAKSEATATAIDHYYTNCKHTHAIGSIPLNISDHNLIFFSKKKETYHKEKILF